MKNSLVLISLVLALTSGIVTSLDCWECLFKSPTSGPQHECLTSKTNLGTKKRCTNTQPGCSMVASELDNGTKVIERSCERLVNYLDGQIGKSFSGSFCYDKKITNQPNRINGKECICVKDSCNSATDINDREDKMIKLLKSIQSDVLEIKNGSPAKENLDRITVRTWMVFISFYAAKVWQIDKM